MKRGRRLRRAVRRGPAGRFSLVLLTVFVLVSTSVAQECEYHRIRWVIDGDTFVIDTGQRVRLIGVDAPEKGDTRRDVEFYAIEAMRFLSQSIQGRRVCLKKDPLHKEDKDQYGRLLRYLFVGDRFINLELLKKGYAYVFTSYPFSWIEEFRRAESEARAKALGLWDNEKRCLWERALTEAMKRADACGRDGTICPWQADRYVGRRVTVLMFVHRVMEGREYVFLDSERDYHSQLNLRVLLPSKKVPDPYGFLGRAVEATGRVELYKGRPELRAETLKVID